MFARLIARFQLSRSTAFLLARADDHLLDDVGLTRHQLEAMHLGLDDTRARLGLFHSLPVPRGIATMAQA
jgi:hypothetical protein